MQIGFVIPYFYPALEYGGPPRSAYELAVALSAAGHDVHVLTTDAGVGRRLSNVEISQALETFGGRLKVRYHPTLSNYLSFRHRMFLAPGLTGLIRQEMAGVDVMHVHEFRTMTSVAAHTAAMAMSTPYIVSPHGGLRKLGKKYLKTIFDSLWGRMIIRDAAAIAAVSGLEVSQALEMGVPKRKIRVLPNPVRIQDYAKLPERGHFRKIQSIGREKIILFLGRLNWIKGADLAIQACSAIEGPVRILVAGPDDGQEKELRTLAKNSSAKVTFLGFLGHDEKLAALVDSDVCVVPSRDEIFGMVTLESLLCNTPVVLSSACGLMGDLEGKVGVLKFQNGDVSDLAKKLTLALENVDLYRSLEETKKFICSQFSTDSVANAAESVYKEIAEAKH